MEVADKIKIENKEFMCTQILFLKQGIVYRVHEVLGDKSFWIMEKNNGYEEVQDKKILEEIDQLLHIKGTDVVIS